MRPSLWFCVPAHGRHEMAAICLRQLRRTCDSLIENGVDATAVVVADDDNLETAAGLEFATVRRDNRWLSRKFNDAIQLACDPAFNARPARFVVPMGTDDFVDWRLFLDLPAQDSMHGFQRISFVREDGREMTARYLNYDGGCGIRIYPRTLMRAAGYRPAEEDRKRACDTSILVNLRRIHGNAMKVWHVGSDARQIVDWKSPGEQLNTYREVAVHRTESVSDPFVALADVFPAESLDEMAAHYGLRVPVAA